MLGVAYTQFQLQQICIVGDLLNFGRSKYVLWGQHTLNFGCSKYVCGGSTYSEWGSMYSLWGK